MIRKILPYILILVALVGLLGPTTKVSAFEIVDFTTNRANNTANSGEKITLRGSAKSSGNFDPLDHCELKGGDITKDSSGKWPEFFPNVSSVFINKQISINYETIVTNKQGVIPEHIIFTLSCYNSSLGLVKKTSDLDVTINPITGITSSVSLIASPSTVPVGTTTIKLSWTTTNVKQGSCVASSIPNNVWSGPKSNDGNIGEDLTVPAGDDLYKLTCDGIGVEGTKVFGTARITTPALGSGPPTTLGEYVAINGCGPGKEVPVIGDKHNSIYPGCFIVASYSLFYIIPSSILWLSAYVFNVLISVTLHSNLFTDSAFIPKAWGVVRDLSNLFFILILLYIAIKIILDLGKGEAKKMIAKVIIMALLINFSMFFTGVIIDSSNILANIFYNKLSVNTKNADGRERLYDSATGEQDVAGGMVNAFDPTKLLNQDFFENGGTIKVLAGSPPVKGPVSPGLIIMVTIVAGLLMFFASYAFLWAGIAFLSRMIELFILIIFSPFAFMSSSVPLLGGVEYLGWESWFKRLLKTSFMAPIFMFFMYFIFMLISTKPSLFDSIIAQSTNPSTIEKILAVVIPALLILILLMKATEFAKKGSGKLGEAMMSGLKVAGGLALGAVTGGTALLGTKVLGGLAAGQLASKGEMWKEQANKGGIGGLIARMKLRTADYGQKATFDIRKTGAGKLLSEKTGINLSRNVIGLGPKEGGFKGAGERKAEKFKEESKLYKTGKTNAEIEAWSKERQAEYDLEKLKAQKAVAEKGGKFNEEEYEKKNGPRPELYKTAEQFNDARMREFQKDIGKRGLLNMVANASVEFSGLKVNKNNYKKDDEYKKQFYMKEGREMTENDAYDQSIGDKINEKRVGVAKLIVGGKAAAGQSKFSAELTKGFEKMDKINQRIGEMKELLKTQTKVMASGIEFGVSTDTGNKDEHGNTIYSVDKDKLTDALSEATAKEKDLNSEMDALNKHIQELKFTKPAEYAIRKAEFESEKARLRNEMFTSTKTIGKLNELKGMEQTIANTKNKIYDLGEQKSAVQKAQEGEAKPAKKEGGGAKPHAPKADTSSSESTGKSGGGAKPHGDSGTTTGGGGGGHHEH